MDYKKVFPNFKCPNCGDEILSDDIKTVRDEDDGLVVLQFQCKKCSRCFGVAFLGITSEDLSKSISAFDNKELPPINFDDVIDAHKYIKNLDENWSKFLQERDTKRLSK